MPTVLDDPELRQRLKRVFTQCRENYSETARSLGLKKEEVRRVLLQPNGVIAKTKARLELALNAYDEKTQNLKQISNTSKTHHTEVPELAQEVIRYVLEAIEAKRGRSQQL